MGRSGTEEIEGFLARVEEQFRPERVILFGSRARGDHLKHSDYDIVVVSRAFEGCPFLERLSMLFGLWDYEFGLDILAYTPEEFEEKKAELGVVGRAANEGLEITCHPPA